MNYEEVYRCKFCKTVFLSEEAVKDHLKKPNPFKKGDFVIQNNHSRAAGMVMRNMRCEGDTVVVDQGHVTPVTLPAYLLEIADVAGAKGSKKMAEEWLNSVIEQRREAERGIDMSNKVLGVILSQPPRKGL